MTVYREFKMIFKQKHEHPLATGETHAWSLERNTLAAAQNHAAAYTVEFVREWEEHEFKANDVVARIETPYIARRIIYIDEVRVLLVDHYSSRGYVLERADFNKFYRPYPKETA